VTKTAYKIVGADLRSVLTRNPITYKVGATIEAAGIYAFTSLSHCHTLRSNIESGLPGARFLELEYEEADVVERQGNGIVLVLRRCRVAAEIVGS
jgi:hypothetical protein